MDAPVSDRVAVTIDGRTTEVARGTTILDAARGMGISIPTLCHYRGMTPYGACRVCLVQIETPRGPKLVASCSHPIDGELAVSTDTDYDGENPDDVPVTVNDDDAAGFAINPTSLTVAEPDGDDTFTLALTSEPADTVTIAVRPHCTIVETETQITGRSVVHSVSNENILFDFNIPVL